MLKLWPSDISSVSQSPEEEADADDVACGCSEWPALRLSRCFRGAVDFSSVLTLSDDPAIQLPGDIAAERLSRGSSRSDSAFLLLLLLLLLLLVLLLLNAGEAARRRSYPFPFAAAANANGGFAARVGLDNNGAWADSAAETFATGAAGASTVTVLSVAIAGAAAATVLVGKASHLLATDPNKPRS